MTGNWRRSLIPGLVALLFAVPVLTVLFHILLPAGDVMAHLADTVLPDYIRNSLFLMVFVGAGVLVTGAGTAWLVVNTQFPGRKVFEWALILPLAMPAYVVAYAYTDFLQVSGPVQSLLRDMTGLGVRELPFPDVRSAGGAAFVLSLVLYPYVYLLARTAFQGEAGRLGEAARTLGSGPLRIFLKISLPVARPALVAGVALALMETLADYGAVSYFGVQTFTTGIYRAWFSMGEPVAAAKLSAMLLGFVGLLLALEYTSRRSARFAGRAGERVSGIPLVRPVARAGAFLTCFLPILLGFLLPAGILFLLAVEGAGVTNFVRFMGWTSNTILLGLITAGIAVAAAFVIRFSMRVDAGAFMRGLGRVAGLGYAVPGSVIAVGILIPLIAADRTLAGWLTELTGERTGLLLTGTVFGLVYAYLVRFMSVALQSVGSGYARLPDSLDDAARSLGAGPRELMARIHWPLMRTSLMTAGLLVMVDVMKELPATLIIRPFNFDTLAVVAHNFAADERLAEAALPALTIALVGLIPVIILSRMIARPPRRTAGERDGAPVPTLAH